jgi:hypothetical protein
VTATKSWGPTLTESVGAEVDSQVAAPTETRTPTKHRAKIAHKRVRMEGWRQGWPGSEEDHSTTRGNDKSDLTLTGLLMEGPIRFKSRQRRIAAIIDVLYGAPKRYRKRHIIITCVRLHSCYYPPQCKVVAIVKFSQVPLANHKLRTGSGKHESGLQCHT